MASGSYPVVAHTAVIVANVSVQLALENERRRYLLIQNISSASIYLAFGIAAETDRGIELGKGEKLEQTAAWGNLWCGAVYAISKTDIPKTVLITEGE